MAFSFILPFVPLYVQVLGVADVTEAAQWAAWISAASALSMVVAQPIWGVIADRYGRKPMLLRSMVGGAIVIGLMGFAQTPLQLLGLRFLQGAVTGVVAAATALVSSATPKHRLGLILGLMQVAMFVGTSVGPLIGGLIADNIGFRYTFYAAAGLLVMAGVVALLFVNERFVPPVRVASSGGMLAGSRALIGLSMFPAVVVVIYLIQAGQVVVSPVLPLYIAHLTGTANAATVAGIVLAGTGVASAVSAILIGRASDRLGPLRVLPVCLLGAALTYVPQAFVANVWELVVLRVALGAFLGGLMPAANALVATVVPSERRGAAYGLIGAANALANGTGPLLGAMIATQFGIPEVFVAAGAVYGLGAAFVGHSARGRPRRPTAGRPAA